jgi:hypothetical protein
MKAATQTCRLKACGLLDLGRRIGDMSRAGDLPRTLCVAETASEEQPLRTLAERFEGYLGLVSLDRTDLAARASEFFADGMVEKHRAGRL